MSSSHDPYHSFARGLRADLETASTLARTYRQIRQQRLQHTEAEINLARDRLQDALEGLTSDLDDIHQSVDVVSRVPKRFGLDDEEIAQRRRFVGDCKRQIEVRSPLLRPAVRLFTNLLFVRGNRNSRNPSLNRPKHRRSAIAPPGGPTLLGKTKWITILTQTKKIQTKHLSGNINHN